MIILETHSDGLFPSALRLRGIIEWVATELGHARLPRLGAPQLHHEHVVPVCVRRQHAIAWGRKIQIDSDISTKRMAQPVHERAQPPSTNRKRSVQLCRQSHVAWMSGPELTDCASGGRTGKEMVECNYERPVLARVQLVKQLFRRHIGRNADLFALHRSNSRARHARGPLEHTGLAENMQSLPHFSLRQDMLLKVVWVVRPLHVHHARLVAVA